MSRLLHFLPIGVWVTGRVKMGDVWTGEAGIGGMAEVCGEKASGYIGAGLGLGVGLKLEIDWSGFKGWNPFI